MGVRAPVRHKTGSDATGRAGASPAPTLTRNDHRPSSHGRGYLPPLICGGAAFYGSQSYLFATAVALTPDLVGNPKMP